VVAVGGSLSAMPTVKTTARVLKAIGEHFDLYGRDYAFAMLLLLALAQCTYTWLT